MSSKSKAKQAATTSSSSSDAKSQATSTSSQAGKNSSKALSREVVTAAVASLFSVITKQAKASSDEKQNLFEDDSFIMVQIGLKRSPDKSRNMPIRIPLTHSIYGQAGCDVCLFVKDPQTDAEDKLTEHPVECITKVLSVSTLRSDYRQYADKIGLVNAFDLFLADSRIIPLLPSLLSKHFFQKKKHPAPVNLAKSNIAEELARARDSTFLHLTGPCILVKVARTSFSAQHVIDNVMAAVPLIVEKIPRKWKNVAGIFLKTSSSMALPVYQSLPTLAGPSAESSSAASEETKGSTQTKQSRDAAPADTKTSTQTKRSRETSATDAPVNTPKRVKESVSATPAAPVNTPKRAKESASVASVNTPKASKESNVVHKAQASKSASNGTKATSTSKPKRKVASSKSSR